MLAIIIGPAPTAKCGSLGNVRSSAKHLLRGVREMQKPIDRPMFGVDFRNSAAHRYHCPIVDQQENGLVRAELHPIANDRHELRHGQILRCEELALVHHGQIDFLAVAIDDDLCVWGRFRMIITR